MDNRLNRNGQLEVSPNHISLKYHDYHIGCEVSTIGSVSPWDCESWQCYSYPALHEPRVHKWSGTDGVISLPCRSQRCCKPIMGHLRARVCGGGRTALSFEWVSLSCDATVWKAMVACIHTSQRKHVMASILLQDVTWQWTRIVRRPDQGSGWTFMQSAHFIALSLCTHPSVRLNNSITIRCQAKSDGFPLQVNTSELHGDKTDGRIPVFCVGARHQHGK